MWERSFLWEQRGDSTLIVAQYGSILITCRSAGKNPKDRRGRLMTSTNPLSPQSSTRAWLCSQIQGTKLLNVNVRDLLETKIIPSVVCINFYSPKVHISTFPCMKKLFIELQEMLRKNWFLYCLNVTRAEKGSHRRQKPWPVFSQYRMDSSQIPFGFSTFSRFFPPKINLP